MTDFKKWDRFDADAAEKEVERKAAEDERERARIAQEQRALKSCQDRASRLKSEAVVCALKAKRGSRRRPPDATGKAGDSDPPKKAKGDPASIARASADEAEAILAGLRGGLGLRDEVIAAAEAGELRRAVTKARECAAQLDAAQALLLEAAGGEPAPAGGGDGDNRAHKQGGGEANTGGTCCGGGGSGGGGHDHSHAHAHQGHAHGGSTGSAGAGHAAGGGGDGGNGANRFAGGRAGSSRREEEEESARKEMAGALEVLRRVKAACRVAEGACLLRWGRAAESTEALRKLLFEDSKSVPAWVARGEAFLVMGAPLLAGLHFDRALELDGGCAAAAKHKESLRSSMSSDADAAAAAGAAAVAGAADGVVPRVRPVEPLPPSSPTLAPRAGSSSAATAAGARGGGDHGNHVTTPVPAEDRTVVVSERPTAGVAGPDRGLARAGEAGLTAGIASTTSSSQGREGRGAAGEAGGGGDGSSIAGDENASAFRLAVAAACESYRSGVVLHQEAFLSTSREKFLRVLELLDVAEAAAATNGMMVALRDDHGEETEGGEGPKGSAASLRDGGGGCDRPEKDRVGGFAGGGAGAGVMRHMRLGCHLNIAASFLLRKTEFESAVDHCTRALVIQPGNSQALVRRAQAHQELGRFRRAVEDLEAAEASVSAGMRHCQGLGERGEEGAEALAEELAEVVKRLDHARWTKVHVGNGKDELSKA